MTPAIETAIHAFVEASRDAETRFLAEIVKIPSDNPPGDCDAAAAARRAPHRGPRLRRRAPQGSGRAGQGRRHGLGDQPHRAPALRRGADDRAQRPWRRRAAGERLDQGPLRRRDRRRLDVRARRRCVEVGHRHLRLRPARRWSAAAPALHGTVELHVTYDEEAGGEIGPRYILEQGLTKPDLAIGAGFSYGVVNAHNGCLHLEVETLGRSAHAAKPFTGVDALEAANAILERALRLAASR